VTLKICYIKTKCAVHISLQLRMHIFHY